MVVRDSSCNIVKDDSKRGRLAYKPDGSVEIMMSCGEVRVFNKIEWTNELDYLEMYKKSGMGTEEFIEDIIEGFCGGCELVIECGGC